MKLEVTTRPGHSESLQAVDWVSSNEILTAGDDHQVLKWSVSRSETSQPLATLRSTTYPSALHICPRGSAGNKHGGGSEAGFLLASTDGKIQLISSTGKIEKTVDAHEGAVLDARWSHDGSSFASCGEDGAVKMWSKAGMLRSVLAQNPRPVYAVDWNGDSAKLAYICGDLAFIKSLRAQSAPLKWKAHEGVTLCLSWSSAADFLITGGEDCKYRVWDQFGRPIFSSVSHYYPITSVAWSPDGSCFAVGSFNVLRLCDRVGWSHTIEKLACGSVASIAWSPDGTQVVAGSGSGTLIHAHVVDRRFWWSNLEITQSHRNRIDIRDVLSEVARERLETSDRITKLQLGYDYLVATTTRQCYIFSNKNWNTPTIMDLKEGAVSLILVAERCFLLVDGSTIATFSFDGRQHAIIKLPGTVQGDAVTERTTALSSDIVVIRDRVARKVVHCFDAQTGKVAGDGKLEHAAEVVQVAVNQCGQSAERRISILDINGDCLVAYVSAYGATSRIEKIGAMISDMRFNNSTNMLAGLQDKKLLVWTNPSAVFIDKELVGRCIFEVDVDDLGKSPYIVGFIDNIVTIRRSDGCLIPSSVPPFAAGIIKCVSDSKWDHAIRLARVLHDPTCWALLASLSAASKNFYIAEMAYSELEEPEKVVALSNIRNETNPHVKSALMSLFNGSVRDAQLNLAQNGQPVKAIMIATSLFQFRKALDLALKYRKHMDTVIGYKQRYLEAIGKRETDPLFLKQRSEVEIDWQHIHEKVKEDLTKEGTIN